MGEFSLKNFMKGECNSIIGFSSINAIPMHFRTFYRGANHNVSTDSESYAVYIFQMVN